MAGIAVGAGQSIFSAVAFSGASYLFHFLEGDDYAAESRRHNKATEALSKAKEKFYEQETREHDRIQKLRQEIHDVNENIERTNKSLDALRKVQTITYEGRTFDREPELGDFYQP